MDLHATNELYLEPLTPRPRPLRRADLDASGGGRAPTVYNSVDLATTLVREIVESVKRNLKVDWTKPHRENVQANVRWAVKMVLRNRGVSRGHFQFILNQVMEQAEARYERWPMAA